MTHCKIPNAETLAEIDWDATLHREPSVICITTNFTGTRAQMWLALQDLDSDYGKLWQRSIEMLKIKMKNWDMRRYRKRIYHGMRGYMWRLWTSAIMNRIYVPIYYQEYRLDIGTRAQMHCKIPNAKTLAEIDWDAKLDREPSVMCTTNFTGTRAQMWRTARFRLRKLWQRSIEMLEMKNWDAQM